MGEGLALPDGGKVHLGWGWGLNYGNGQYALYSADRVTDPYGQVTYIDHDGSLCGNNVRCFNRITKVREPGGRYLKFTYSDNVGTQSSPQFLLLRVEAFDGPGSGGADGNLLQWVHYTYGSYHDITTLVTQSITY